MEQCMPDYCPSEEILAFRSDLEYVDLADGFQLFNEYKLYKMEGKTISEASWYLDFSGKLDLYTDYG